MAAWTRWDPRWYLWVARQGESKGQPAGQPPRVPPPFQMGPLGPGGGVLSLLWLLLSFLGVASECTRGRRAFLDALALGEAVGEDLGAFLKLWNSLPLDACLPMGSCPPTHRQRLPS